MKTGLVRWEWHSLDHVAAEESETEASTTARRRGTGFTSTRSTPSPTATIFISARSTWAGYQLEGGTGKILWRLGGLKSSFKMGPGTETAWQHDGRILADGDVTFFDDGSNPPIHQQSRAVRIALDFKTHEAHLVSSYTHANPPLLAASQGNMQTLADGNTVVGYGGVPAISEYATTARCCSTPTCRTTCPSTEPSASPGAAARRARRRCSPASTTPAKRRSCTSSWNGATEVASWRVLAGKHTGSLASQTTIPASGFESSTTLPEKYARVAVQALDAAGHVLGTSTDGPGDQLRRLAARVHRRSE